MDNELLQGARNAIRICLRVEPSDRVFILTDRKSLDTNIKDDIENFTHLTDVVGLARKAADLDALEWGGLLHDVGKIGVPDAVLLKPDRLTREERAVMNAHPVTGANIIAPVTKLAPRKMCCHSEAVPVPSTETFWSRSRPTVSRSITPITLSSGNGGWAA